MMTLQTIALLCQLAVAGIGNSDMKQLECQIFYINCMSEGDQSWPSPSGSDVLRKCVLLRRIALIKADK